MGVDDDGEFATEEDIGNVHESDVVPTRDPKDIVAGLPPGLLGNPQAVPRCSLAQVATSAELCPADTQVGVYALHDRGWEGAAWPDRQCDAGSGPVGGVRARGHGERGYAVVDGASGAHGAGGYGFTVASNEIPESSSRGSN